MQPLAIQILSFANTILIGLMAGFLYDLYILLTKKIRPKKWGTDLGDLIFWLVTIVMVYGLLLWFNWGEVRLYVFLGLLIGVLIYHNLCSRPINKLLFKLYKLIVTVVVYLWMIILFPFRLVSRIIIVPLGIVGLLFSRLSQGLKKVWWILLGRRLHGLTRKARTGLRQKLKELRRRLKPGKGPPKDT